MWGRRLALQSMCKLRIYLWRYIKGVRVRKLVRDVFVAGGLPKDTYVNRDHLQLEDKLSDEIDTGYQIVCVTGPTKSGKSVLCKTVLKNNNTLWIDGGQIQDSMEFWSQAVHKLNLVVEISEGRIEGLSAGIRGFITGKSDKSINKKQVFDIKRLVFDECKDQNIAIVIDDFHYLSEELQKEVIQSVKSEIFEGLSVLLIAVPHRTFDTVTVQKEMEGRFSNIEIPLWEEQELEKIAKMGFPALKINPPEDAIGFFTKESLGSPLLMQRFCLKICQHNKIRESGKRFSNIDFDEAVLKNIAEVISEQFGFPTYKRLSTGPQYRTDRLPRSVIGFDDTKDIYECILIAIANTGPKSTITYNEIRDSLREIISDSEIPQKHQVSHALGQMSRIAKDEIGGEPVLEWKDDTLYITDPHLMFYMRWTLKPQ